MSAYDLVVIGHQSITEIHSLGESLRMEYGGASLFSSMAACWPGLRLALVTRMAKDDFFLVDPLKAKGIDVYATPSTETTYLRVLHATANPDERAIFQTKSSGFFEVGQVAPLEARLVHLAAITDQEFTVEFLAGLKALGFALSVDMQGFVRQRDRRTSEIRFGDVGAKEEIVRMADFVKLDVVEAKVLTGTDNPSEAAKVIEEWGGAEMLITSADGVLARSGGKDYFEPYSNKSNNGRTGRGDTTIGAYLARRFDHSVADSLRFASAVASIKVESLGPFSGSLEDVLARMRQTPSEGGNGENGTMQP